MGADDSSGLKGNNSKNQTGKNVLSATVKKIGLNAMPGYVLFFAEKNSKILKSVGKSSSTLCLLITMNKNYCFL